MTVSDQIIAVINSLCEKFGIIIDWTADNVLPYIELLCTKIVAYEIWTSVFYMALWIFLSVFMWIVFIPTYKKAKADEWDFDYCLMPWVSVFIGVVAVVFSITALVNIGVQTFDIIEAKVFPEKTIYEFIYNLIEYGPNA